MKYGLSSAQHPGLTINPVCNPGGDIQLHLATIYSSLNASRQYFHPENIKLSHRCNFEVARTLISAVAMKIAREQSFFPRSNCSARQYTLLGILCGYSRVPLCF